MLASRGSGGLAGWDSNQTAGTHLDACQIGQQGSRLKLRLATMAGVRVKKEERERCSSAPGLLFLSVFQNCKPGHGGKQALGRQQQRELWAPGPLVPFLAELNSLPFLPPLLPDKHLKIRGASVGARVRQRTDGV